MPRIGRRRGIGVERDDTARDVEEIFDVEVDTSLTFSRTGAEEARGAEEGQGRSPPTRIGDDATDLDLPARKVDAPIDFTSNEYGQDDPE